MIDGDILDEKKNRLADKYTAYELAEVLDLDVWDIIEAFPEKVIELREPR